MRDWEAEFERARRQRAKSKARLTLDRFLFWASPLNWIAAVLYAILHKSHKEGK